MDRKDEPQSWNDVLDKDDLTTAYIVGYHKRDDEVRLLRAENERLREALEHIHRYADVAPVMHLTQEKRGVWEMAIEGAAMHVKRAASAALHEGREDADG